MIDRQGEIDVGTAAKRAIALAEARVRDTIGTLDHLAGRRVNSCDPAQVEAMRFAAFSTIPVKEVSVVGPDAETLCTDLGRKLFSEPTIVKDVRNIFANSPIKFSQSRAGSHGA